MARVAPRVYVDAADIARLECIAAQLPQDQRVHIILDDGEQLLGVISARPSMQTFFDPHGCEGTNALLRLELALDDGRPHPDGIRELWLDHIDGVTRAPNPSPPEPSRAWPADPNAPTVE